VLATDLALQETVVEDVHDDADRHDHCFWIMAGFRVVCGSGRIPQAEPHYAGSKAFAATQPILLTKSRHHASEQACRIVSNPRIEERDAKPIGVQP
jgi:hypothetical protein